MRSDGTVKNCLFAVVVVDDDRFGGGPRRGNLVTFTCGAVHFSCKRESAASKR